MKFTHLHVHSHYSLLDGLPKIDDLLSYVKLLGMESVAITDHGVLYGAVEFYKKAKPQGIKPIIGAEVYVARESRLQKRSGIDDKIYHLVLLVKNEEGYKNLVKLITKAQLEGFYYKPRIDEELLSQHAKGLIALSACLKGKIPSAVVYNRPEEAQDLAVRYKELFGPNGFYLELQDHPNIPEQQKANAGLLALAKRLDIPLVLTNDSHYLKPEDNEVQDILMLVNTGAKADDSERLTMKDEDFSLKTPQQMLEISKKLGAPEAFENTQKIVEACNFEFKLGQTSLPAFTTPNNQSPDDYLKELCLIGLKSEKKKLRETSAVLERLNYELDVIKQTGFAPYFLIVQDFVRWAKENRIVVGPGRGSAGGSLVAYLADITEVEPLEHSLLFERFLNPARVSMPDIDLDFTDRRRDEVINYVAEKYGREKVAQIITFGTMAARAAVRDVGRAMGLAYSFCDQVAKMIPFGMDLSEALDKVAEFRQLYTTDENAKKLIDVSKKLEGVARHASTHACGVIISDQPLDDIVPLQHPTQDDAAIVTQYEMHSIEDLGLLKMDFLGLKNLTIIEDTLARIYKVRNEEVDVAKIPPNDKETYELLRQGKSTSVFQLESEGMKKYLRELQPNRFEDIVAMVALYRPGPLQFIPDYIDRKQGRKPIQYLHPKLEPILKNTQGICVFQEQLMQIARDVAGFSLAEADILRKAVGKKIPELLKAQKDKFVQGAVQNGASQKVAEELWEWVLPFASYGFNKCLVGDTEIVSPSGKIRTIEEIYKQSRKKRPYKETGRSVVSLNDNLKLNSGHIIEVAQNGVKPVYELTASSGKKIQATANHRFLTAEGWKELSELKSGERIALARTWPTNKLGQLKIAEYKIVTLAHVLSEGNTCHPCGFYLYSNSYKEVQEFVTSLEMFSNTKATVKLRNRLGKDEYEVYASRINTKEKSEAVEWIKRYCCLDYKKATEKFIPPFVFRLSSQQLAIFLGKLWNGDGCIDKKRGVIYYATSSEKMACQIQNLLLRFSIFAKLHHKQFKYRDTFKKGWVVSLTRYDNIIKFSQSLGSHLIGKRKEDLELLLLNHKIINSQPEQHIFARGTFDTVPIAFKAEIRELCQKENLSMQKVARWAGVSERLFWHDGRKVGLQRETMQRIAEALDSARLQDLAQSDIFWDKVKAIERQGEKMTYDLSIAQNHNFVANGFIVHNSHSVAYGLIAYNTAYLKAHYPEEFMSAVLTSEKADIERISFLIDECKSMAIEVLAPEINQSFRNFSVVPGQHQIRFGLLAIKNVGSNIVDAILEERKSNGPFKDFSDFVSRINDKDFNKKSLESLAKAGVFDQMEDRAAILDNMENILAFNRDLRREKTNPQKSLFGNGLAVAAPTLNLKKSPPAKTDLKLLWEKELLGLYISSHPLHNLKNIIQSKALPIKELRDSFFSYTVRVAGVISSIKKIITKKGQPMIFMKLEDLTDKAEIVVFPSILEQKPELFQENKIVFVTGKIDQRKEEVPTLICQDIEEILEV